MPPSLTIATLSSAAAVESCRALERRCAELSEERAGLATALAEVQERAARLEGELTHLTGQQNLNQRIQYHKKVRAGRALSGRGMYPP